jgi:hypothetical protein
MLPITPPSLLENLFDPLGHLLRVSHFTFTTRLSQQKEFVMEKLMILPALALSYSLMLDFLIEAYFGSMAMRGVSVVIPRESFLWQKQDTQSTFSQFIELGQI